jgi:hypothetical protein
MTQTALEIIDYLEDRYDINISTTNFIINKIDKAVEDAFAAGLEAGQDSDCIDWEL